MKYISYIIILLFFLAAAYSVDNRNTSFDTRWLPIVRSLTSINSSSVELVWGPSGLIKDVDIDKLSGNFSVNLYVGNGIQTLNAEVFYKANRLNSTDSIIIVGLDSDTVYHACLSAKWYGENDTIKVDSLRYIPPPPCRLVRTYTSGKLN
jgi:hypothetical protein